MATTAQTVFDYAMGLLDEVNAAGETDTTATAEYKVRALFILNILRGELYQYSDGYLSVTSGIRPISTVLTALTDSVGVDDFLAQTIMPYGLAAHLLIDENPKAASFFQSRYDELLARYGANTPSEFTDITQTYGGFNVGDYYEDEE